MSVGSEELDAPLAKLLAGDASTRGLFILGTYGAGKSHALTLVRDTAHERGFATAWLSADTAESILNHPQRFMATLLRTVQVGETLEAYADVLVRLLLSEKATANLVNSASGILPTNAYVDNAIKYSLIDVRDRHRKGRLVDPSDLDGLIGLICADTLSASPGTKNFRGTAYRLLEFAVAVVRLAGAKGLVLIVDEVESIVTKMPNTLSRRGALRVLSALLCGINTPDLKVALAITPDGWSWLKDEVKTPDHWTSHVPTEPLPQLGDILRKVPVYVCQPLDVQQTGHVVERVRTLHEGVYQTRCPDREWAQFLVSIAKGRPSVRLAIRDAVDRLDYHRFGGNSRRAS